MKDSFHLGLSMILVHDQSNSLSAGYIPSPFKEKLQLICNLIGAVFIKKNENEKMMDSFIIEIEFHEGESMSFSVSFLFYLFFFSIFSKPSFSFFIISLFLSLFLLLFSAICFLSFFRPLLILFLLFFFFGPSFISGCFFPLSFLFLKKTQISSVQKEFFLEKERRKDKKKVRNNNKNLQS